MSEDVKDVESNESNAQPQLFENEGDDKGAADKGHDDPMTIDDDQMTVRDDTDDDVSSSQVLENKGNDDHDDDDGHLHEKSKDDREEFEL